MSAKKVSDAEIVAAIREHGVEKAAATLGMGRRSVQTRRRQIEEQQGITVNSPNSPGVQYARSYPARLPLVVDSGVILVGSDAHYWPGIISPAHRGMCYLAKELQPVASILNGDGFDGAGISRHPPIGWEKKPTVKQELECVEERTHEIADATGKGELFWTMGNHDARFENKLAAQTPEMEGVPGFELQDRFARWKFGMSIWASDSVVIKHRFKGGVHATHNNTLWAGKTMVTGHLHSLKVTPLSDYNGTRWGVDTGTLADPYGPQFAYAEDNPLNHRSGLIVLTFHRGVLLTPEIVRVVSDTEIDFRGKLYTV